MRARHARHLLAAASVIGVVALLPATAGAHPEECAASNAFTDTATVAWAGWIDQPEDCASPAEVARRDDSGAQLAAGESEGTDNLTLTSSTPKQPPFETETDFNSDLAFENGYAFGGNYDGVQIWDVRDGQTPALASLIHCPGSQNDVTVNDGILVTSTDSVRNQARVRGQRVPTDDAPRLRQGHELGGAADLRRPRTRIGRSTSVDVQTDCGSHTHTVLPERDRLIVYVQSYDIPGRHGDAQVRLRGAARPDLDRLDPEAQPGRRARRRRAGAVPGRRQRRHDRHAARHHRLP